MDCQLLSTVQIEFAENPIIAAREPLLRHMSRKDL